MCSSLVYGQFYCDGQCVFVSNGIFALAVKGVYAGALVKKSWHYPKSVPRDIIDRNFEN